MANGWNVLVELAIVSLIAAGPARAADARAACRDCDCARPEIVALRDLPERDWREDFATRGNFRAAGTYQGNERWAFESFSLVKLQPSPTATIESIPTSRSIALGDVEPGLKQNAAPPPPWSAAPGSVSITGWVENRFTAVVVRGTVNAASGPAGSRSRQGLIARWDRHHSYYWFYIDFASGLAFIAKQSAGTAEAVPFPQSERKVPGFGNTTAYKLEFRLVGDALQGKVLAPDGALLAETPEIHDAEPHVCGISGVNAELSMAAPFAPLRASFADVSATALKPPR